MGTVHAAPEAAGSDAPDHDRGMRTDRLARAVVRGPALSGNARRMASEPKTAPGPDERLVTRGGQLTSATARPPAIRFDVVIPTTGRSSLWPLLRRLDGAGWERLIVVDDRGGGPALDPPTGEVLASGGRGPAAARNRGWRAASAPWVVFLDDDVVPRAGWEGRLAEDLAGAPPRVAASQGRVHVPLPRDRRPTDWERNVAALERACWVTADLAVRRAALGSVGGFDERFPRAYREDADLALRLTGAGWALARGAREVLHAVPAASPWISVAKQAGNADDALMSALHGRDWRRRAVAPRGRLPGHAATTALAAGAALAALAQRPRAGGALAGAWALATGELAWRRIAPGPRMPREVAAMLATSAVLPAAATFHHLRGRARARRLVRGRSLAPRPARRPDAVLLDRDGTLVVDVPFNGDPARVTPVSGARSALDRLRAAGIPTAVVTNQSGIARGLLSAEQVAAVNARVERLLGPLGPWLVCPHGPGDGCACRKPRPGLVLDAAARLGVPPERCALIGDIGADVQAARAAGARAILVPNERTRADEVAAAPETAACLEDAVDQLLGVT
jgi:histidinol-phosphate phosphatase family protein